MTVKTYEIEIDLGLDEDEYKPIAYRPPREGECYLDTWEYGNIQLCYSDDEYYNHGECRIIVKYIESSQ